ncbi:hypothetical protein NDU88_000085 [Pleurodeles waltl]|uniref:Uncharacterized protein n=1 Tax=Pleurodeles waltl TaxID=8319 RepID=A0AAV7U384_PLEWA|nr:hypothetical protein NDU88_000085 [Pleurodeles waltl]
MQADPPSLLVSLRHVRLSLLHLPPPSAQPEAAEELQRRHLENTGRGMNQASPGGVRGPGGLPPARGGSCTGRRYLLRLRALRAASGRYGPPPGATGRGRRYKGCCCARSRPQEPQEPRQHQDRAPLVAQNEAARHGARKWAGAPGFLKALPGVPLVLGRRSPHPAAPRSAPPHPAARPTARTSVWRSHEPPEHRPRAHSVSRSIMAAVTSPQPERPRCAPIAHARLTVMHSSLLVEKCCIHSPAGCAFQHPATGHLHFLLYDQYWPADASSSSSHEYMFKQKLEETTLHLN